MCQKRIEIISQLLSEIEVNIPNKAIKNEAVSKSTIGWQLDHALKVVNGVCQTMIDSKPEDYKANFNIVIKMILLFGVIPRGKGSTPKRVLPPDVITEDDLLKQLTRAKTIIKKINPLPKTSYFEHPYFGNLLKKQTIRFIEVHTKHHLKIVRDILN